MSNAAEELTEQLQPGETVEAVVFGAWGWGNGVEAPGYGEPDPPPVPMDIRGKLLSWADASPLMRSWSFSGGYGAPECYAARIWTDRRVFWVTQYDGSTALDSAERNPREYATDDLPSMPGG